MFSLKMAFMQIKFRVICYDIKSLNDRVIDQYSASMYIFIDVSMCNNANLSCLT